MLLDPETLRSRARNRGGARRRPRRARRPGQAGALPVGARGGDEPCADVAEATGRARHGPRAWSVRSLRSNGMLVGRRRHPPVRAAAASSGSSTATATAELVAELGFIATRELIFGTHVHVGIDSPDKAIYVADGIRRYLPLLLALSTNSPFWEGRQHRSDVGADADLPGLPAGRRAAALRQLGDLLAPGRPDDALRRDRGLHLPLVGRAPAPEARHGRDADLRPGHAARGHRRVRGAHAVALATASRELFDEGEPLVEQPWELIDDNKVRAAVRGMEGRARRLRPRPATSPRPSWPIGCSPSSSPSAAELGCSAELDRVVRDRRRGHRRPPPARLRRRATATTCGSWSRPPSR